MSMDNLKAFYKKVDGDSALQQKMQAVATKGKVDHDSAVADMVKVGSDAGYDFTADHVKLAHKATAGKLSDDELKGIAGGAGLGYTCTGAVLKDTCKYITWS